MFMTTLGALHREKGDHRARQGNLFSTKSMKALLGTTMASSNPERRGQGTIRARHTWASGRVSWAGPCPSARRGFPDPCTAMHLSQRKKCQALSLLVILRTLCIGNNWWQQSAEQLSAQVHALARKQRGSLISEAGQSHGVIPI